MSEIVDNLQKLYDKQKSLSEEITKIEDSITNEACNYCGCAIRYDKMANTNLVIRHFIFYKKWAISFFQYFSIDKDLYSTITNWEITSHIAKELLIELFDKPNLKSNKIKPSTIKHREYKNFILLKKFNHKDTDLTEYITESEKSVNLFLNENTDLTAEEKDILRTSINSNSIYLIKLLNRNINGYQHEDFKVSKLTSPRELQLLNIFAKLGEFSDQHKKEYLLNKLTNELAVNEVERQISKI